MRRPTVRAGELHVYWGREARGENPDVIYHSGDGVPKCDRRLLHYALSCDRMETDLDNGGIKFSPSFIAELERRGYDITTLKFSIRKKAPTPPQGAEP